MASGTFSVDEHIPNVLVFPPGTDLHDNILYKEGKIILQDKVRTQGLKIIARVCYSGDNSCSYLWEECFQFAKHHRFSLSTAIPSCSNIKGRLLFGIYKEEQSKNDRAILYNTGPITGNPF
jgi:hypothetical protein